MIRNLIFAFLFLATCSCRDQGRPVVRARLPQDTVDYLCSHADLVAVVDITTGVDWIEGKRPSGKLPSLVKAKLIRVLKGNEKKEETVNFSNVPVMLPSGTAKIELALYNGPHLVFLVNSGDHFDLLTDQSLLHETNGTVSPIWRREPGNDVRHRSIPFDEAIGDVVREIKEDTEQAPALYQQNAPEI